MTRSTLGAIGATLLLTGVPVPDVSARRWNPMRTGRRTAFTTTRPATKRSRSRSAVWGR